MSRLDVYLTEKGIYASRERAKRAIAAGRVTVNGCSVRKASREVGPSDVVDAAPDPVPFVSRGGIKLEGAFVLYPLEIRGKRCLDIGASTGGFTEVLLQRGAASVTAVDVGHGQLAEVLRADPRVTNLEGTDIRTLSVDTYGEAFDFVSIDVSFISLCHVLPAAVRYMRPDACCAALIKPQFELGRSALNKKGIVRDPRLLPRAVDTVSDCARACGFTVQKTAESPVTGGDGNREFFIILTKTV